MLSGTTTVFTDTLTNIDYADLTGGTGNNTFTVSGYTKAGKLTGGGGSDTVIASKTAAVAAAFTLSDTALTAGDGLNLTLTPSSGINNASLTGGTTANTFTLLGWSGVATIAGGSGTNFDTLVGEDVASNWAVSGTNAGQLTYGSAIVNFSGIENLTGGTASDTFAFSSTAKVAGAIIGGAGLNTLDYSLYTSATTTNLVTNATTGATLGATGIENLVGGGTANDTLVGPLDANTWTLTASGAGDIDGDYTFAGVEKLTGGTNDDNFVVTGTSGVAFTAVNGGTGNDTLQGAASASENKWTITAANAGALTVGSIALVYADIENLTGAGNADSFRFYAGKTISGQVQGGGGRDLLDYRLYATNLTVNLAGGTATGTGGVSGIEDVYGGTKVDTITGDANDNLLVGNAGNDNITGGLGDDVLLGGAGNDILDGQDGRDILVGGNGQDQLFGGAGEDLLTGAKLINSYYNETSKDVDAALIDAVLTSWKDGADYEDRIDAMTVTLVAIIEEESPTKADTLHGDPLDLDWFLRNSTQDVIINFDQPLGEEITAY